MDKLIVAQGFKKLPKVQKIAQSGHTDGEDESDQVLECDDPAFDQEEITLD